MVELTLIHGDCLSVLKMMSSEFVDCIITSPPYWGLRDYGKEACKIWDGDPYCEHEWEVCIARHDNLRPSKVSDKTIVGSNKELRFRTGGIVEEAICKKCVPAGTLVFADAFRPIEKICEGEKIQGLNGEQIVLRTFKRKYKGKIVKLSVRYLGEFYFTPDHEILVAEFERLRLQRNWERHWETTLKNLRWVEAKNLKTIRLKGVFHCVVVPKFNIEEDVILDFSKYLRRHGKTFIRPKMRLTETLAYIMGWYVAEGCVSNSVIFSLSSEEDENISKLTDAIKELGYKPNVKKVKRENCVNVILPSRPLARAFKEWFGSDARNKRIPSFLFKARKEIIRAFLDGYFHGDGTLGKYSSNLVYRISTASLNLLRSVQFLFLKLGEVWGVSKKKATKSVISGREIRGKNSYCLFKTLRNTEHKFYFENDDYYFFPITKVELVDFDDYVFNLQTTEELYLLPFVVHNCGAWYGQLGLEPTLDLYLKHILQITAELKRVLKRTGVMFWVHGDSYSAKSTHSNKKGITNYDNLSSDYGRRSGRTVRHEGRFHDDMPEKCLLLQNYRLAIRMIEEQGWILRNVLIWYKPNHMPSSVRDRLTNTYEPVFMFVKSKKYWFDLDAIRIPHKYPSARSKNATNKHRGYGNPVYSGFEWDASKHPLGKNPGDMWVLPTEPFPDAHFAVFPTKLAELLVKASCPPEICRYCGFIRERIVVQGEFIKTGGKRKKDTPSVSEREKREGTGYYYKEAVGWTSCECKGDDKWRSGTVLDPFLGSGTTMVAARNLGRNCIGIEINSEYIRIAKRRLNWGNSIEFMKFRYLEEEDIERNPFILSR